MTGAMEPFGTLEGGTKVARITIAAGDLTASFLTFGAILQDLRLAGHDAPLVLGFEKLEDYLAHSKSFGITAGPCANRTARGHAVVDGNVLKLDANEGRNHLHGGRVGTGLMPWQVKSSEADAVTFSLEVPDGHMGYPGPIRLEAAFRVRPPSTLVVRYTAETAAPTLVNLAHHSYFNLSGEETILDHMLTVRADTYLAVDEEKIPTGAPQRVVGTDFDFRKARPIGANPSGTEPALDHNFCVGRERADLRHVARAFAPASKVALDVATTEPGLQVYDGYMLNVPVPGLDGRKMGAHAGFCMETQVWPDAANHPRYPQATLLPGEPVTQLTHYAFSRSD